MWNMLPHSHDQTNMNKIREIVEATASVSSKCAVDAVLQQASQLSDVERVLLYLKLPVGRTQDLDPLKQPLNPLGSRTEIQLTITWIKTHLEMDLEVSLPKREVYNEYMHYCTTNNIKALSTADFGKVMKQVFPSVRPRRLGHRGKSKYCYSGLRKKYILQVPSLPDLSQPSGESSSMNAGKDNNAYHGMTNENDSDNAASCIVLEWAEKCHNIKCEHLHQLALHLLHKNYVDSRSVHAFALRSSERSKGGAFGKHHDLQLQLQRKLQEKDHNREQKRKMQDASPSMCKSYLDRSNKNRRRSGASSRNPSGDTSSAYTSSSNSQDGHLVPGTEIKPNFNGQNMIAGFDNLTDSTNGLQQNLSSFNTNVKVNAKIDNCVTLSSIIGSKAANSIVQPCIKQENVMFNNGDGDVSNGNNDNAVELNLNEGSTVEEINARNFCSRNNVNPPKTYLLSSPIQAKNALNNALTTKDRYKSIQPKGCENGNTITYVSNLNNFSNLNAINNNVIMVNKPSCPAKTSAWPDNVQSNSAKSLLVSHSQANVNDKIIGHPKINEQDDLNGPTSTFPNDSDEQNISELRKVLQKSLPSGSAPLVRDASTKIHSNITSLVQFTDGNIQDLELEAGSSVLRRRVSFQTSQDGSLSLGNLSQQTSYNNINSLSIPQSPTTHTKGFTPITVNSQQCLSHPHSHPSSANASPFVSPRNTPLLRSRHNSGQSNSTYVTPRSTPLTPSEIPLNNFNHVSESATPFMSPALTPLYSRSRHNSSQGLRGAYGTPTGRSRHSSGAPSYRHNPYGDDGGRRGGGKFRSRHSSGSVPPSPQSAPLSPLTQETNESLQSSYKKQHPNMQGYVDLRRRHQSAGDIIHYHPQCKAMFAASNNNQPVITDTLGQEIHNAFNNNFMNVSIASTSVSNVDATPNGGNRPQSVPLPNMVMPSSGAEIDFKSHPNTPLVNQTSFHFGPDCNLSQPSSYAPTPVPSEMNDFTDYSNLDFPLDVTLGENSGGNLDGLDSSFANLNQSSDIVQGNIGSEHPRSTGLVQQQIVEGSVQIPQDSGNSNNVPPNMNPFMNTYNPSEQISFCQCEESSCNTTITMANNQVTMGGGTTLMQLPSNHPSGTFSSNYAVQRQNSINNNNNNLTVNCQNKIVNAHVNLMNESSYTGQDKLQPGTTNHSLVNPLSSPNFIISGSSQITLSAFNPSRNNNFMMTEFDTSSHLDEEFQSSLAGLGEHLGDHDFSTLVLDVNKE